MTAVDICKPREVFAGCLQSGFPGSIVCNLFECRAFRIDFLRLVMGQVLNAKQSLAFGLFQWSFTCCCCSLQFRWKHLIGAYNMAKHCNFLDFLRISEIICPVTYIKLKNCYVAETGRLDRLSFMYNRLGISLTTNGLFVCLGYWLPSLL